MNKYKVKMIDYTTGFEVTYYLESEHQVSAEIYAKASSPIGWQVKEVVLTD